VQWTNTTGQPISFVNLRYSMPDTSSGGGTTSTLDLYVNGAFRQALNVNSKQSWLYEGDNNYNGNDQNPADGDPRVFWDESHAFVTGAPIAAGSTFSLVKDSAPAHLTRRGRRCCEPSRGARPGRPEAR
jgi:hypothetical protein